MTDDEDERPVIIVCQGPPRCDLQGDEARAAQVAGCPWCKYISVNEDGSATVQEPGNA